MAPQPIPAETVAAVAASSLNLDGCLGKTVDDFCGKYGKVGDGINHCAHFVSHVLELRIPNAGLCSNVGSNEESKWEYKDRMKGFCVRVNQVFNSCNNRAYWDGKSAPATCLIVATIQANIESKTPLTIGSMTTKHIGFLVGDQVYHYSNTQDKVIKMPASEFKNHYGAKTILLRCDLP